MGTNKKNHCLKVVKIVTVDLQMRTLVKATQESKKEKEKIQVKATVLVIVEVVAEVKVIVKAKIKASHPQQ